MERLDDLQLSGLKIWQDTERFCFGMDAVVLSGFVRVPKGAKVLDLGTGTGILPLLLSAKTEASELTGLEIQHESALMAARSVEQNGLSERIHIVEGDIKEAAALFGAASFSVIVSNPPYIAQDSGLHNPEDALAIARHEILCVFADVARESAAVLPHGGKLFLVHRPERLAELICTLREYRLEVKRLRFVHSFAEREPSMVLLEAAKEGRPGMKVEAPLILYEREGVYSEEMKRDYGF
ncbi:MAG: tRNA1(Val) (adenine(37)-N6)-methyltransferase [Lachnospiraceae bacterium]|nr:tRNA1(Val) (adenine(37)-N6)-methyltransferase [Lachnospiraceae bacterium]